MANLQERHDGAWHERSSSQAVTQFVNDGQVRFCLPCCHPQERHHEVHSSVTGTAFSRAEAPLDGNVVHLTGAMTRFTLDESDFDAVQLTQQEQLASANHHQPVAASQLLCRPTHIPTMNVVDLIAVPRPPVQAPRTPSLPPPESSSVVSIYPNRCYHKQPNSSSPPNLHQQSIHASTVSTSASSYGPSTRPNDGAARLVSAFVQKNPFLQPFSTDHTPLRVVKQATSRTVMAGCSTKLSFCVEDQLHREVHYQWYLGQKQLTGMTSPHLLISNAGSKHEGLYICRATVIDNVSMATVNGTIHLFSNWAEVRVSKQHGECPTIIIQPCPVIAHYGRHVELRCEAVGSPEPSYQWYHNGYVLEKETCSLLRIHSATERHHGYYSCKVENDYGGRASNIVQVHIHMSDTPEPPPTDKNSNAPTIIQQPQSRQVEHGSSILLSCSAQGIEPFRYQWYKDNIPLSKSNTHEHAIGQSCDSDSGLYICHVSNMYGEQWSNPARVAVKPKPIKPAVIWPSLTTTHESRPIIAVCSAYTQCSANSPPVYQNGCETTESNSCHAMASVVASDSSMVDCARSPCSKTRQEKQRDSVQLLPDSESVATAHCMNRFSAEVSRAVDLRSPICTVDPPPVILTHPPAHLTICVGNSLSLACQARSLCGQHLTFQWLKDSCSLPGETNAELHLCVNDIRCAGTYVCEVADGGQPAYSHPCCVSVS